ncbi:MAG: hypothetical protein CMF22_11395 [Idiomarinaceae bacterium]|nr:hypothetical protein [Idiomarinaceae bacterium]|tara:strand:- start:53 stop:316 length:264 start_codon:yes stop_codon:yes gene_type:complete
MEPTLPVKHPNATIWWTHRRRMAYAAGVWIILQTILFCALGIFWPSLIDTIGVVIGWSYGASVGVIMAYFGNTIATDVVSTKRGLND